MINLLALVVLTAAVPKVVELPDSHSDRVVVQLYVQAPPNMSDREQASWDVLADALYDGTEEFSRDRLAQYSAQYGIPLMIESMPGYMRIQVVEPKKGLKVGCQIVEALCKRAAFDAETVAESAKRLKARRLSTWDEALYELDPPYANVTLDIVKGLYQTAFRPENMTIVFGGDFEAGKGQFEAEDRFKPWGAPAPPRSRFDRSPRQRTRHREVVSTFELRGNPISLTKADGPAELLAAFAIGVGKEGAMHRVLREKLGWSYRQEAVLWPSVDGWLPRFIFAKKSADLTLGGSARDELVKDIEGWNDATLVRAKAMLGTTISGENPVSPLWVGQAGPMGKELEDRCSWAGLNAMLFKIPIDWGNVTTLTDVVKLDELKAAGTKLLQDANISVIPGG